MKKRIARQQTPIHNPNTIGFSFWGQWVLANALTVAIVITISLTIDYIPQTVIGWSIIGICLSLVQQIYLQRYLRLEKWALFSIIGWIVGVSIGKMAVGWQAHSWDVDWALIGLVVGLAQYFSMRKCVAQAGWWLLASSVALIMAGSLGGATALLEDWFMFKGWIDLDQELTEIIGYTLAATVGGAVYGALTGGWLIWLIRHKSYPQRGIA